MFKKKTVEDIELSGKTILLRSDFNVPLQDGKIIDDYRIRQSLPTIEYLLKHKVKLVICSHLGRPKGKVDESMSLKQVAVRLQQLLDHKVSFVNDCVGPKVQEQVSQMNPDDILLLENVRFHPEEEADDPDFAKQMASLADIYVNDSFGVDHHPAVTVSDIPKYLPGVAGFLLKKEIENLTKVMENPNHPLAAIIGGAKVSDKIDILSRLIKIADFIALGGALANPFLVAKGINIGDSLYDPADLPIAKQILREAEAEAKKRSFVFSIPRDGIVADRIDPMAPTRIVGWEDHTIAETERYPKAITKQATHIGAHEKILDIGPASAAFIAGEVQLANTVIWNGTMGVTETPGKDGQVGPTARGTEEVIKALIGELGHKPFTVVGGGDTVGYIEYRKLIDKFDHVSTGGGASLEVLAGHKLPGVEALQDK